MAIVPSTQPATPGAVLAAPSQQPPALKPATWRGVPFAVLNSLGGGGRRLAVHQYPGKEAIWSEDLGQGAGRYQLHGFLLDSDPKLGGGSIASQRALWIAACRQKGSGTLVHPTLGNLTVNVEHWTIGDALDGRRYAEVSLELVDAGAQTFPSATTSGATGGTAASNPVSQAASKTAASNLQTSAKWGAVYALSTLAAGQSISALTLLGMGTGLLGLAGVRADLVASIAGWAAKAIVLAQDATSLLRLTAVLPGNYGRYAAGGNSGLTGSNASAYSSSTTVDDLISAASTQRVAVATAAAAFEAVAANTDLTNPIDLQPAASALVDALVASCADPADAIRLLLQLIASTVDGLQTQTVYVVSQLVLHAAAAALCEASANYQPSSATDAALRITQICPMLDALALAASSIGDDADYVALSACRGAVATDLRSRGATLAQVKTFDQAMPMPALALAQSLYGDATRADQLVAQADPVNPLFFPTSFQALAS